MKLLSKRTEDEKLAKGCAKGKPQFQEALYKRFYSKMFGVCLRYANNRESAEDLLQDGFITVLNKIGSFKGKGSLEGWVRRIMVNTVMEYHRKNARFVPVVDIDQATEADSGHDIVGRMSQHEILGAINALPIGYRTVFNLYAIEGYSHREISEKLSISEGTSKSQLSRARVMLGKKINHQREGAYGKAK